MLYSRQYDDLLYSANQLVKLREINCKLMLGNTNALMSYKRIGQYWGGGGHLQNIFQAQTGNSNSVLMIDTITRPTQ